MSTPTERKPPKAPPKTPAAPRPSASVLLISPINQILLLHRVKKASSFPSAHVFPGGALSAIHDGIIPPPSSPAHYIDGPAYRLAAIRETFEECGILLAKSKTTGTLFTAVSDAERDEGRRAVHAGSVRFTDLLEKWGATPDTEGLIPFTRWITPSSVPRRFTTQMYIYFLPLASPTRAPEMPGTSTAETEESTLVIPQPTHDGGIEHTAVRFLPASTWISLASQNKIILFPPQFLLTSLLAPFLSPSTSSTAPHSSLPDLARERERTLAFLSTPRSYDGTPEPNWTEACICPVVLGKGQYGSTGQDSIAGVGKDTAVLDLSWPGDEAGGWEGGRRGLKEWVVTTTFRKEGPRDVRVRRRGDILGGRSGEGSVAPTAGTSGGTKL